MDAKVLSSPWLHGCKFAPDGESQHLAGSVGMLHRPFHTTTESRAERQPFIGNHYALTWDGRLDNREDLVAVLRDSLTMESTDVAIVAAAFERWDTDCFEKAEWGMGSIYLHF